MRFIHDPDLVAAALSRNGLDDITNALVRRYCQNAAPVDLAVIEGDTCYYQGKPPRKTQRVVWRQDEETR